MYLRLQDSRSEFDRKRVQKRLFQARRKHDDEIEMMLDRDHDDDLPKLSSFTGRAAPEVTRDGSCILSIQILDIMHLMI